jgi:hypothetical protein
MQRMLVRWYGIALLSAVALLGAGCTSTPPGPPVEAPRLVVGDHWIYKITDNLRLGLVTMQDAQVVAVTAGVASVRLVYSNQYGNTEMIEEIDAGGGLVAGSIKDLRARRFPEPLAMYRFPLQQGETWRQTVNTISPETQLPGQILLYATVQGRSVVTVPPGIFNATYLYRIIQLDDAEFWRTRTERRDSVWFVPEVKAPARELHDASFIQRDGPESPLIRTENTTRELISFQPGSR